jgi:hypothetical protein
MLLRPICPSGGKRNDHFLSPFPDQRQAAESGVGRDPADADTAAEQMLSTRADVLFWSLGMTMRERLAIAALCGWNNVPRDNAVMLAEWQKRTTEPGNQPTKVAWERVVDAVLDELTADPGRDVLRAGCAEAAKDQCRPVTINLVDAGGMLQAMIRAIKEGK